MRLSTLIATVLAALVCASTAHPGDPAPAAGAAGAIRRSDEFVQRVDNATRLGLQWLRSAQAPDGSYRDWAEYPGAVTALAYHTLRACGTPRDDPAARNAWTALRRVYRRGDLRTYSAAIYLMAIAQHGDAAATSSDEHDVTLTKDDATWAGEIARFLVGCQRSGGAWSYGSKDRADQWDLSNTQFALLGLKSAARCGVDIENSVWKKALGHLLRTQQRTGAKVARDPSPTPAMDQARGWGYDARAMERSSILFDASMTAGGVSSVVICRSELGLEAGGKGAAELPAESERAIRDGLAALGAGWKRGAVDTYGLYGTERAGVLAGVEWMSTVDWYGEGAKALLERQAADGSWEGDPSPVRGLDLATTRIVETCFSLLFLRRATRPVTVGALTPSGSAPEPDFAAAATLEGDALTGFLELVLDRWQRTPDAASKERLFDQATALGAKIVEPLLAMMSSPDSARRASAHALLLRATGLAFGFDPAVPPAESAEALGRWRDWLASVRDRLTYDGASKRLAARTPGEASAAMVATRAAYRDLEKWRETSDSSDRDKWWNEDVRRAYIVVDAFVKTDWEAWDPAIDRDLLSSCLYWTAGRAEDEGRWNDARRAYEFHTAKFPDVSGRIRCCCIPDLLVRSGDLDGAMMWLATIAAQATGYGKARALLRLGDVRAATGDRKAAAADYKAAEAAMAAWNGQSDENGAAVSDSSAKWSRNAFSSEITARGVWLGEKAAGLPRPSWIGGPSTDWAHLRDRIVVVCILDKVKDRVPFALAGLEKFAQANAGRPVTVAVVVHASGVEGFDPSRQTFRQFVADLRSKWKTTVPFAVVDDAGAAGLPGDEYTDGVLVADATGTFVHVHRTSETSLEVALGIAQALTDRLVAKQPPPGAGPTPPPK